MAYARWSTAAAEIEEEGEEKEEEELEGVVAGACPPDMASGEAASATTTLSLCRVAFIVFHQPLALKLSGVCTRTLRVADGASVAGKSSDKA